MTTDFYLIMCGVLGGWLLMALCIRWVGEFRAKRRHAKRAKRDAQRKLQLIEQRAQRDVALSSYDDLRSTDSIVPIPLTMFVRNRMKTSDELWLDGSAAERKIHDTYQ